MVAYAGPSSLCCMGSMGVSCGCLGVLARWGGVCGSGGSLAFARRWLFDGAVVARASSGDRSGHDW